MTGSPVSSRQVRVQTDSPSSTRPSCSKPTWAACQPPGGDKLGPPVSIGDGRTFGAAMGGGVSAIGLAATSSGSGGTGSIATALDCARPRSTAPRAKPTPQAISQGSSRNDPISSRP